MVRRDRPEADAACDRGKTQYRSGERDQSPDVRQRFANLGLEPVGGTPQAFGNHLRSELAKWGKVIKEAGIQAN